MRSIIYYIRENEYLDIINQKQEDMFFYEIEDMFFYEIIERLNKENYNFIAKFDKYDLFIANDKNKKFLLIKAPEYDCQIYRYEQYKELNLKDNVIPIEIINSESETEENSTSNKIRLSFNKLNLGGSSEKNNSKEHNITQTKKSTKTICYFLRLIITFNDDVCDTIIYDIIDKETDISSNIYKRKTRFIEEINGFFKQIKGSDEDITKNVERLEDFNKLVEILGKK